VEPAAEHRTRPASSFRVRQQRWAWHHRVPVGELTFLAGRPKQGKGAVAASLAAQATCGTLVGDWHGTPVDVVIVAAEDRPETVLVPRLAAAGADLDRVHVWPLGEGLQLADAAGELRAEVERTGSRLVVLDPVGAFLGGVDAHRDNDVRDALAPLGLLAADLDAAALIVAHLRKNMGGGDPVAGIVGSVGFGGRARSVLSVAAHPDDDGTRLVAATGVNLAPADLPAWRYRVEGAAVTVGGVAVEEVARVVWLGEEAVDHATLYDDAEDRSERTEAQTWLRDELTDRGGQAAPVDLRKAAEAAGLAWRTVQRARQRLGVTSVRAGFPSSSVWSLPPSGAAVPPTVSGGATGATAGAA